MAITVTATQSGTGISNGIALTVKVLTGTAVSPLGTVNSAGQVASAELAITPASTGSWVYGAVLNDAAAGTFTPDAASTFSQNQYFAGDAASFGTFRSTSTTTAATPVTLGSTSTGGAHSMFIALAEIQASGTLAEDASSPATAYTTSATATSTPSFTPPAGSVLVAMVASDFTGTAGQSMTMGVTDSSGLTWTRAALAQFASGANTFDVTSVWLAKVSSGGGPSTGGSLQENLSVAATAGTGHWGDIALRFTGAAGTGGSASATAVQSITLSTTADNSVVVALVMDWNGVDGSSRTWATLNGTTPTAGNGYELLYNRDTSVGYAAYAAYWPDAGPAGSVTVGLTSPSGTTKPTILAIEVASVLVPLVTTGAATSVTSSGAVLNGTVNPQGSAATWQFEYGLTTSYGTSVPATAQSAGSGTTAITVAQAVSGLSPSTTYHYRAKASSASGTGTGADQTFTTSSVTVLQSGGAAVLPGVAQLIVEASFDHATPVQGLGAFILDVSVLETGTLGTASDWTEITAWVRSVSLSRPSDRQQGPLYSYPPGTASVVLANGDGRFDPDNASGPWYPGLTAMVPVRVRAVWAGASYPLFQGYVDSWDDDGANYAGHYAETTLACTDGQKILSGITIAATETAAGASEDAGARISRVLDAVGWYTGNGSGARDLDTGTVTLQGTTFGDTAWSLMQAASDAEVGDLYMAASGAVTFRNRLSVLTSARSATAQAVFNDDGTGMAYRVLPRARDDATIANDIQAARTGGTLQEVKDTASIAKYIFPRTYSRSDLILTSDSDTLNWADWILAIASSDENRFSQMVITPRRDPGDLWPLVLAARPADRITVVRNPPGVATVTKDCFIRGITHDISVGGDWTVTWTLQDASRYGGFLVLDNPVLGQLDASALA